MAVTLNVILLFVVLFYVYPLKSLFGLLVTLYTGQAVGVRMPDGGIAIGTLPREESCWLENHPPRSAQFAQFASPL